MRFTMEVEPVGTRNELAQILEDFAEGLRASKVANDRITEDEGNAGLIVQGMATVGGWTLEANGRD